LTGPATRAVLALRRSASSVADRKRDDERLPDDRYDRQRGYRQALPENNFNNSASKVLANVVSAFLKKGKLPGMNWTVDEKQWR